MQKITLQPRSCECCGGNDLDQVWQSQSNVKRPSDTWIFPFSIAVCRNCGFCFNSPCPKQDDLIRYYADGISGYKEIGLPYSIDIRMAVLERYSSSTGTFAEVGGDQPGEFHRRCAPLFNKQLSIDISDDISSELRTVHNIEENTVDVIAHYDVLEHVAEVKDFLTGCHRALKPGGVMICEVPDIRLYPRNLLLQEFEHVNHFSTATLSAIACQVGLNPIEFSHICSRPFGLLAVFRKEAASIPDKWSLYEYIDALACINGGKEQIRKCMENISLMRKQLSLAGDAHKKVTIWGVTNFLQSLLDGYKLPDSIMVVDSDPRRKNHLTREGVSVAQPKDVLGHIRRSELLVICAPRYKNEILEWIAQHTDKIFNEESLLVLGAGPSGETLR
jgi:SAM-dependent methyltransferase